MKQVILPLVLATFTAAAATTATTATTATNATRTGSAIAANGIGDAPACSSCHGVSGTGGDQAGMIVPSLAGQPAGYMAKQLDDFASGARASPVMQPIAKALDSADMRTVSAYYAGLIPPAPPAARREQADALRRGLALARTGSHEQRVEGCDNCHGPEGTGLAPSYPRLAGQTQSYLDGQLTAWAEGGRGNDLLGVMQGIARSLSPEDRKAVALYFATRSAGSSGPQSAAVP